MIHREERGRPRLLLYFRSIPVKIMFIILIMVVPLNALAIGLSRTAADSMIRQAEISIRNVAENYCTELDSRMSAAAYLLWDFRSNSADGQVLFMQGDGLEYESAKIKFFYDIESAMKLSDGADGYFYYMDNKDDIVLCHADGSIRQADLREYLEEIIGGEHVRGWSLLEIMGRPAMVLLVPLEDTVYGGWIFLDDVLENLEQDLQYEQMEMSFERKKPAGSGGTSVISSYVERGDVYLTVSLSQDEITGNITGFYKVMQMGVIITLVVVPLLYILISRVLISPLKVLIRAQKELREGNLDYRITHKGKSPEFAYTFDSFNRMAENIRSMKIENYEKELDRKRMELQNLQLQIRPHFLLNTFNLIYTLAQGGESTGAIQEIILYLTDYFRYIFRSGKSLELFCKEQKLIEGYLKMAAVRYPGCVQAEYSYDPEIYYTRVPPLLIHNFVENIIKHVVNQRTVTHISIVGQYDEGKVTFMIMDDGPGISGEKLKELTESMYAVSEDHGHIGFRNSLRRLKYFYGEEADIVITSEEGTGTCVTIQFPYNLEVEDEPDHCE